MHFKGFVFDKEAFTKEFERVIQAINRMYDVTEASQLPLYLADEEERVRAVAKGRLQMLHKQRKPWWYWIMNKVGQ